MRTCATVTCRAENALVTLLNDESLSMMTAGFLHANESYYAYVVLICYGDINSLPSPNIEHGVRVFLRHAMLFRFQFLSLRVCDQK